MNKVEKHGVSEPNWKPTIGLVALLLPIAIFATVCGSRWLQQADEYLDLGDYSPDGTKFVAYRYERNETYTNKGASVYDMQTMEKVCDLSQFATNRWNPLRWSSDGKKLVGIDDELWDFDTGIVVEIGNPPKKLLSRKSAELMKSCFDRCDQPIFINRITGTNQGKTRPRLEIIVGDSIVDTFEFGRDERIEWLDLTSNGILLLSITPNAATRGDYVATNGVTNSCLFIDIARKQRVPLPANSDRIGGDSEYFSEVLPSTTGEQEVVVRPFNDPTTALTTVPLSKGMPHSVSADGNRIVQCCGFGTKRYTITVRELDSGQEREYVTPSNVYLSRLSNRECFFLNASGDLIRMDLGDGSQTELMNIRPYHYAWKAGALGGLALLWVVALAGGTMWRTKHPFAEMMCLLLLSLFVVIGWSSFGSGFMGRIDVDSTVFVFFSAALTFFMLWASTAKSFWGATLPSCIAGAAVAVGVLFLWCEGNPYRAVEGSIGSTVILVWMLVGMWAVRSVGIISNEPVEANSTVTDRARSQMSLKQILLLVGSCCLLLSAIRFVDLSEFVAIPNAATLVVWLATYVGVLSLISIAACMAALSVEKILFSGLVFFLAAPSAAGFHFLLTRSWEVHLLWSQRTRYGLIVAIGFLVWTVCRYCQAKGYRFIRTTQPTEYETKSKVEPAT